MMQIIQMTGSWKLNLYLTLKLCLCSYVRMSVSDIMGIPAKSVNCGGTGMIESLGDRKLSVSPSPLGCPDPPLFPVCVGNYLPALNETPFLELVSCLTYTSS